MRVPISTLLLLLSLSLTSCEIVEFFNNCNFYNDERDGFRMSFSENFVTLPVGERQTLVLNRSWLDDNLIREELDCNPNRWEYIPDGIAIVNENTLELEALAVGEARIRVIVTGGAGTKTAEMVVSVIE